jgi:hypothetical protein
MPVYEYERERVISMTDDLYYSEDRSKTSCQTQLSGVVPPRDPEGENSDLVPSYVLHGSGRFRRDRILLLFRATCTRYPEEREFWSCSEIS